MFAKRNVEKCKITLNEIESLKEDERVFKPIGQTIFYYRQNVYLKREEIDGH